MTGCTASRPEVFLLTIILLAAVSGCTPESKKEPPAPKFIVRDSFDTGTLNFVRALKTDGRFLWVGTSTGILKVNRLSGEMVKTYTVEDGLTSPYIFSINIDSSGGAWFGSDAGGLMNLAGENWKTYGTQEGLSDLWVYDIKFHPDGTMWLATWNGVSRFDPKAPEGSQFKIYDTTDGLANKWVYGLGIDLDRSLWFGTEEGVTHFDPAAPAGKQWHTYNHANGLGAPNELALARKKTTGERYDELVKDSGIELAPDRSYSGHFHDISILDDLGKETYNENYIFTLAIDSAGNKWFGTWGGGVSRFDGKKWTNFTTKEGVAGNIVYALELDPVSGIWAGTNHGLSYFNGSSWVSFTEKNGLLPGDVYAVSVDSERNVWVGQRGGVVRLSPGAAIAETSG